MTFRCLILLIFLFTPRLWAETVTAGSAEVTTTDSSPKTCSQLAKESPELADSLLLEGTKETTPPLSVMERAKLCLSGVGDAWKETLKTLLLDPAHYLFVESPALHKRFLDDCNAQLKCKLQLFDEAYGRAPSKSELSLLTSEMSFARLDVLYRNAKSRMNSGYMQDQRFLASMKNKDWLQNKAPAPPVTGSFWKSVEELYEKEKTKWQCLKPAAATELFCYYLAQIIDPAAAAGIVAKAPKIAKLARAIASSGFAGKFSKTSKLFVDSDLVSFYDAKGPQLFGEINPGDTFTVIIQNNTLHLGKDIPGTNGSPGTSGSHLKLMEIMGHEGLHAHEFYGRGGAIRFNKDGSVDISGYHKQDNEDPRAYKRIEALVRSIAPDATIRSTPDRLSTLPAPP